jgi:hypothetical protein
LPRERAAIHVLPRTVVDFLKQDAAIERFTTLAVNRCQPTR